MREATKMKQILVPETKHTQDNTVLCYEGQSMPPETIIAARNDAGNDARKDARNHARNAKL